MLKIQKTTKPRRSIIRIIIDLIIIIESLFIGMSYYWPPDIIRYFAFINIALSLVLGIINLFLCTKTLFKNSHAVIAYTILICSTFIYGIMIRESIVYSVIFISSVMFMQTMYVHGLDNKNIQLFLKCNVLLAILHISKSLQNESYMYNALVLAYDNPNMAGIVLSATIMPLIVGGYYWESTFRKTVLSAITIILIYFLFQTGNRGSIFAVFVLILFLVRYRKEIKINIIISVILSLFPLIFAISYIALMSMIPTETMFFGKPLFSGREFEWRSLFEYFINEPFSIHLLPTGGLNMFMATVVEFGILSFFSYIALLLAVKPFGGKVVSQKFRQVAYLAFLCVYVQQTFEATIVLGSYGVYIFSYLLLGVACSQDGNLTNESLKKRVHGG